MLDFNQWVKELYSDLMRVYRRMGGGSVLPVPETDDMLEPGVPDRTEVLMLQDNLEEARNQVGMALEKLEWVYGRRELQQDFLIEEHKKFEVFADETFANAKKE